MDIQQEQNQHDDTPHIDRRSQKEEQPLEEASDLQNAALPQVPVRDNTDCKDELRTKDTPILGALIDSEAVLDPRALEDRHYTNRELYQEYRSMIRRRYFDNHYRGPIPFARQIASLIGSIKIYSISGFLAFKANKEGNLAELLQETANERAYEFGLNKPNAHFNQGEFTLALKSFQKALEAAPYRRAEIYLSLADFSERIQRMQDALKETGSLDAFVVSDNFTWGDHQSRLRTSVIYDRDPAGEGLQMIQGSAVSGGFSNGYHPLDLAAVLQELQETSIPWQTLAGESYLRAAMEFEERDGREMGDDHHIDKLYADAARMLEMSDEAEILYTHYNNGCTGRGSVHRADRRNEARLYQALDDSDRALETYSKYMLSSFDAIQSIENYHEFFMMCRKHADIEAMPAEALMIRHLDSWGEEWQRYWEEDTTPGQYDRMLFHQWRGKMHHALGNSEEARADLTLAHLDVQEFLERMNEGGEQLVNEYEIIHKDIAGLLKTLDE